MFPGLQARGDGVGWLEAGDAERDRLASKSF
jgi:hypothetical protein